MRALLCVPARGGAMCGTTPPLHLCDCSSGDPTDAKWEKHVPPPPPVTLARWGQHLIASASPPTSKNSDGICMNGSSSSSGADCSNAKGNGTYTADDEGNCYQSTDTAGCYLSADLSKCQGSSSSSSSGGSSTCPQNTTNYGTADIPNCVCTNGATNPPDCTSCTGGTTTDAPTACSTSSSSSSGGDCTAAQKCDPNNNCYDPNASCGSSSSAAAAAVRHAYPEARAMSAATLPPVLVIPAHVLTVVM